jgi:hypothetical protein
MKTESTQVRPGINAIWTPLVMRLPVTDWKLLHGGLTMFTMKAAVLAAGYPMSTAEHAAGRVIGRVDRNVARALAKQGIKRACILNLQIGGTEHHLAADVEDQCLCHVLLWGDEINKLPHLVLIAEQDERPESEGKRNYPCSRVEGGHWLKIDELQRAFETRIGGRE